MNNVKKTIYALEIIFGYFPAAFFYTVAEEKHQPIQEGPYSRP